MTTLWGVRTRPAKGSIRIRPSASSILRRAFTEAGRYTVLAPIFGFVLLPFAWFAMTALKSRQEIVQNPFGLPMDPQWENLAKAWTLGRFSIYLPNTFIYSFCIVLGVCVVCALSGYAVTRFRFTGRSVVLATMIMGLALPFQAIMVPLYFLVNDLGLLGTRAGLILPMIALQIPFGTFLMSAFYQTSPDELAQAARIDGASEWKIFSTIMFPLALPGLSTLAIFQFMWSWTMFLPALVLVQSDQLRPVALALVLFTGRYETDRGLIAAGILMAIVPVIIIYLFAQRKLVEGITMGAVK
jgi:ABC-type glycerol-3-phosphate transport system permease component